MSFVNANGLILLFLLIFMLLVKFNLLKYVMIAMLGTGIVQWLVSGYMDLMVIALMLGIFGVTCTTNKI